MSTITIEVFARSNGKFVATADKDGEDATGTGVTEFMAAGAALARLLGNQAPVQPTVGPVLRTRVAYTHAGIDNLLRMAVESDRSVEIDYVDSSGRASYDRLVKPIEVSNGSVLTLDDASGELRRFKLSGIGKVEEVAVD